LRAEEAKHAGRSPPLTRQATNLETDISRVYDCKKCPGYCCSYPLIALDKRDVERLARHHGMEFEEARRAFTREAHGRKYAMKRKKDRHFGAICRFFDTVKRRCTIYEARPSVCRSFPGKGRCGYYDFLAFERRSQEDPTWVAVTTNR
jgi:Fe-S-cluster containining protein